MSSTCGNCDCADKSQCTKKRNGFQVDAIVETGLNMRFEYYESVSGAAAGGENECKCGAGCTCSSCPCHK